MSKDDIPSAIITGLLLSCLVFAFTVLVVLLASCTYSQAAEKYELTDERRVKVGDIYDPGHGRRIQIRDSRRNIIGYIEKDGTVTDKRRRKLGKVEDD